MHRYRIGRVRRAGIGWRDAGQYHEDLGRSIAGGWRGDLRRLKYRTQRILGRGDGFCGKWW